MILQHGAGGMQDYSQKMHLDAVTATEAGVDLGASGRNGGFNNYENYQYHRNSLIHMAEEQGITLKI